MKVSQIVVLFQILEIHIHTDTHFTVFIPLYCFGFIVIHGLFIKSAREFLLKLVKLLAQGQYGVQTLQVLTSEDSALSPVLCNLGSV